MDLIEIERTFQKEGALFIASNHRNAFLYLMQSEIIMHGLVRKCVKLAILDNMYIRFGSK